MKTLQSLVPKQLVKHHIAGAGLGAMMIDQVKTFCRYPDSLTGYLRHNILFVSADMREDKLGLFHKRKEIQTKIEEQLKIFGYQYVLREIRIK